jgi:hypothetical protein
LFLEHFRLLLALFFFSLSLFLQRLLLQLLLIHGFVLMSTFYPLNASSQPEIANLHGAIFVQKDVGYWKRSGVFF